MDDFATVAIAAATSIVTTGGAGLIWYARLKNLELRARLARLEQERDDERQAKEREAQARRLAEEQARKVQNNRHSGRRLAEDWALNERAVIVGIYKRLEPLMEYLENHLNRPDYLDPDAPAGRRPMGWEDEG